MKGVLFFIAGHRSHKGAGSRDGQRSLKFQSSRRVGGNQRIGAGITGLQSTKRELVLGLSTEDHTILLPLVGQWLATTDAGREGRVLTFWQV